MPCLIVLAGLLFPRIILFVMWITGFFTEAHPWDTRFLPFIGWFFLPCTTLCWGLCYVWGMGEFTLGWMMAMAICVLLDLLGSGRAASSSSSS